MFAEAEGPIPALGGRTRRDRSVTGVRRAVDLVSASSAVVVIVGQRFSPVIDTRLPVRCLGCGRRVWVGDGVGGGLTSICRRASGCHQRETDREES